MGRYMASFHRPDTVTHLHEMAARYRKLALDTWDSKTLSILKEMIRDYDDEARAMEGAEEGER